MAMVSSTPVLSSYGTSRPAYQYSGRQLARPYGPRPVAGKESPLDALGHSAGFSADAPVMQRIDICESSDDDISQPMKFSALTRALLEAEQASPGKAPGRAAAARGETPSKAAQLRISRRSPDSSSSASASRRTVSVPAACVYRDEPVSSQSHLTPGQGLHSRAPTATGMHSGSIRVKRVPVGTGTFLRGAPVRKQKRTPQTDDEENQPPAGLADSGLREKHQLDRPQSRARGEHHVPLAPISVNTPLRPAPPPPAPPQLQQQPPPPPPKMTVLETATAAGGASTTKSKRKRTFFLLNGKHFSLMGRVGKGGSSEVFRVVAENSKIFALKRVKLDDSDESAVRGYKGEIDLLKKLRNVDRVVVLFDWEIDEDKKILSLLMELGEIDLNRLLSSRLQAETARLDIPFVRFYWKEMLECVQSVHEHDIVHSDLKPANFLLVAGRLKLIDFGIANAIDIDNTVNVHRDSHVGTPNYMSPESIQDTNSAHSQERYGSREKIMKVGKPSDVWSLGCILYQMVYGRPPFAHISNQIHRIMAITNPSVVIEFPSLGVGAVTVPPTLKAVLRSSLCRDPSKRPTITDLLSGRDGGWLSPDGGEDLRISKEILAQVIQRVAERFRDEKKPPPTDEEIKMYPASFYERIRQLLENGQ